ncbi:MAG TPA: MFS transporter [Rhodothermales bacterium]|nr:MFS transporter [Rhodothermales bacterium]
MTVPAPAAPTLAARAARAAVVVAALGYFVDIYDLVLFAVLRVPSLQSLGVTGDAVLTQGVFLFNAQMTGMLVGGLVWGVLGDLRGRKSVLFGSIILYSLANLANAAVTSIPQYAVLRFIAGVGLAGELGAGVTLVSELMRRETRGLGTMVIAGFGTLGAVAAGLVGNQLPWRWAYVVGGCLGLALLLLRVGVFESGMFEATKAGGARRGAFLSLFATADRARRYLACIMVGLPIWYAVGVLVVLSPELAAGLGVRGEVTVARAIILCYLGLSIGDFMSGAVSQWMRSRRRAMLLFILALQATVVVYLLARGVSATAFYGLCLAVGFFAGYWAVFMTNASEQFGTNLRATVTTTVPNFVRGAVVPITLAFSALRAPLGTPGAALAVGAACTALALLALLLLPERFDADLDYVEPL